MTRRQTNGKSESNRENNHRKTDICNHTCQNGIRQHCGITPKEIPHLLFKQSQERCRNIKIIIHGAAREVGRSCIELQYKNTKIILDAGLKLTEEGTKFPRGMYDLSEIDGVFISH